MQKLAQALREFFRKGDLLLLLLCFGQFGASSFVYFKF